MTRESTSRDTQPTASSAAAGASCARGAPPRWRPFAAKHLEAFGNLLDNPIAQLHRAPKP